ncbi:hypothetical protein BGZ83_008401 [Gryganskiella cystojenkinii]|nr:hypothetical protein BGZ83_008401 [Gryganskiella cystojenkinii]
MDLPSIQTSPSLSYRAPSPRSSTSPVLPSLSLSLSLQHRSYSSSSLASLSSSTSSSTSDRHLSLSPAPLTPCDRDHRSGSDVHRPTTMMLPKLPMLPLPSPHQFIYHSSSSSENPYSYHNSHPHHHYSAGGDYFYPRPSYSHSQQFATPKEEEREPISPSQHRLRTSSSLNDLKSSTMNDSYHNYQFFMSPKQEDRDLSFLPSIKPTTNMSTTAALPPAPYGGPSTPRDYHHDSNNTHCSISNTIDMEVDDDEEEDDESDDDERSSASLMSSSRSRSVSLALGNMSEASASMTSLMSAASSDSMYSGSSPSPTPVPTSTTNQLLMCPVCSRAFKPSKNQNCNLRRHLKNVHNMSPTMHPRKCKWDSLPDGRVKDDKDRKERTRKSKRIWAQKFRQRRKVEEAAVVLSMLSQAM